MKFGSGSLFPLENFYLHFLLAIIIHLFMFITEEEFRARLVTMEQELVLLREENIKLKSSGKDLAINL